MRTGPRPFLLALPSDDIVAEEVEDAGSAPVGVDVPGMITVAQAHEMRILLLPCVVAAVVQSAGDVSQHPFHSCLVLNGRFLHKPAHIARREGQVWSCVQQVPQRTDDAPVRCGIDGGRYACLAQLEAWLHGNVTGVAPSQPGVLENLRCVRALAQGDAVCRLSHLQAEVVVQQPYITHLERALHLRLELVDVIGAAPPS